MHAFSPPQSMDSEISTFFPKPTTDLGTASDNPPEERPLGNFSKLCPDVRTLIWRYLMPEIKRRIEMPSEAWEAVVDSETNLQLVSSDSLGILRTNRAVLEDVAEDLYRQRALYFSIHPDKHIWTLQNLDVNPCKLLHTDFSRFSKIRIDIYGPRRQDSGQLLVLRNNIWGLITFLQGFRSVSEPDSWYYNPFRHLLKLNEHFFRGLEGIDIMPEDIMKDAVDLLELPEIELAFLSYGSFSWFNRDNPRKSLPKTHQCDLEYILGLFHNLKNARDAKVILPSQANGNSFLEKCAAQAEQSMQSRVGATKASQKAHKDLLAEHRHLAITLEDVLDALRGPTAADLRLHRFMNWKTYNHHISLLITRYEPQSMKQWKASYKLGLRFLNWQILREVVRNTFLGIPEEYRQELLLEISEGNGNNDDDDEDFKDDPHPDQLWRSFLENKFARTRDPADQFPSVEDGWAGKEREGWEASFPGGIRAGILRHTESTWDFL